MFSKLVLTSFYVSILCLKYKFGVKFYMEQSKSASGVQTTNSFSHTVYVKITCVKFYLRNRKTRAKTSALKKYCFIFFAKYCLTYCVLFYLPRNLKN